MRDAYLSANQFSIFAIIGSVEVEGLTGALLIVGVGVGMLDNGIPKSDPVLI